MIPGKGDGRQQGFYKWLIDQARSKAGAEEIAEQVVIGLVWTLCRSGESAGLAMTPQSYTRTLNWSGALAGQPLVELVDGIRSWEPFESAVAMAAINTLCQPDLARFEHVVELPQQAGNLAVFEHFLPRIKGARIVVVGRYPGLERYEQEYDLRVVERQPGPDNYPDTAAEELLPAADWVFLTASSIINKTFPRLAELSRLATLVLMGPSMPWLPELTDWGVDYLAGTQVRDADLLQRCVAEGGGRILFDEALQYVVADIGRPRMQAVREEISRMAGVRDRLKQGMEDWYSAGSRGRFPQLAGYEEVLAGLSALDTQYKWMWDARNPAGGRE
ncbi:MAG: hypothetical protein COS82_00915 [Zetaproteobacteria bacterium CG06_land_8_20_14_3_00_59_53]|nr:MAG: hypothetical protein COX56_01970 [Zetaproteobacteria bacterium CG23_combo_of_CG06-09_8_20_14_all_59_86]PIQ66009.1 MAG: hypothetical protein COV97_01530 [Zetaproteobacteria bacterium CG11_big_fil_rev_8_21_14_0_20_59_439]PIU71489.1 MAG: hypothetical protein COS82_00915 [Zetaproteobacteria bacterium CG06_land_8_20_14_3_00_59_53]PIU97747.1 MAG: hypothetical protein COS62_01895 [Zetaproteobacteria bacterium CG03_land_8_20_14_0_80_59_51]PIY47316.1 MAG: hypothetical protein COZ02_02680 [Zetapr